MTTLRVGESCIIPHSNKTTGTQITVIGIRGGRARISTKTVDISQNEVDKAKGPSEDIRGFTDESRKSA